MVTELFLDLSLPVSDEVKLLIAFSLFCLSVNYTYVPFCTYVSQAFRKKNQKKGVQKTSEEIQDGKNSPVVTNGDEDIPTGTGSKYQQKKAKKQAKKQSKVPCKMCKNVVLFFS